MTIDQRLRRLSAERLRGIRRGIEKESLRAQPDGRLALTPHPAALGSPLTHPHITTDFSESQLELITGVRASADSAVEELTAVYLLKGEGWPASTLRQVTATATSRALTSDAAGQISGSGLEPGVYSVLVARQGYQDLLKASVALPGAGALEFALIPAPQPIGTHPLNDTGITSAQCYRAGSNLLVSCTSPEAIALNDQQDGMIGRDVTHPDNGDGHLGFSFELLERAGSSYFDATECIRDRVTGLVWEGKPVDGPRAASIRYRRGSIGSDPLLAQHVEFVNNQKLCGYSNWRVPTVTELLSIVNHGDSLPSVDEYWLPNTSIENAYWSSEKHAVDCTYWVVSFNYGSSGLYSPIACDRAAFALRLVRGEEVPEQRFVFETIAFESDAENNVAVDLGTGLKWRRCSEGQRWDGVTCVGGSSRFTVLDALAHAKTTDGWRVPNIKELSSIHDRSFLNPAIDPIVFPSTPVGIVPYVSSSPHVLGSGWHWYVQFDNLNQLVGTHWSQGGLWRLRLVRD